MKKIYRDVPRKILSDDADESLNQSFELNHYADS